MTDQPIPDAVVPATEPVASISGPFFNRHDRLAGLIAFLVALAGYVWTLAPSVTLEDAGEFLTAARSLGVPHPPGYPTWTLMAWVWQRLIPFGNIAWRVNLMSAVFGAVAIGLLALLISKSARAMCERVEFLRDVVTERWWTAVVVASSDSAALMLAFSPASGRGMWSQSVISEPRAFNVFYLVVTLALLYRWSFEPARRWRLYLAAFVWGVSMTNHQTLFLLTVAFPAFVLFVDRKFGRDVLVPILGVIVGLIAKMALTKDSMFREGPFSMVVFTLIAGGACFWLYQLCRDRSGLMSQWKQVLVLYAAVLLGLSLYGYMPLASATNPPMNWGYTSTPAGFIHHFTREQYDKVRIERALFVGNRAVWGQCLLFFQDLITQYNLAFTALALLAVVFYDDLDRRGRDWVKFLLIAFGCLSLGFLFLSNPTSEKQKLATDHVFFLPAHCVYAFWIAYGMIFGSGYLLQQKPALRQAALVIVGAIAVLPLVPVVRNWATQEQRGHDFGYAFGYLIFKPGGGYPDMDKGAILYGGTDPGRFVPTYMIFVESQVPPRAKTKFTKYSESASFDRRDVYIITQNALADDTYMSYIRDQYDTGRPNPDDPVTLTNRPPWQNSLLHAFWRPLGRDTAYPEERLWIPSVQDAQMVFQQYIQDLQTRPPLPGEEVHVENGRANVNGVAGVMAINGYLTKMIFDRNKDKHSFYVEESYPIPWMYPYLEPFGIILKLNKDPLPGPDQSPEYWKNIVARDRAYWDAFTKQLREDPKFQRDEIAQRAFSKLRAAIGGVYAFRRMADEAEYAFKQAIDLCPDSVEGNFRLSQLYVETARFDDALTVLERYKKRDPFNVHIVETIRQVGEVRKLIEAEQAAEQQYRDNPHDTANALKLLAAYAHHQRFDAMDGLASALIAGPDLQSNDFLRVAQTYADVHRYDRVSDVLTAFVQRQPQNAIAWYNLAVVYAIRQNCDNSLAALERAMALDSGKGEAHQMAQQDPRFGPCRQLPLFQQIVGTPTGLTPAPQNAAPFTITR